MIDYKYTVGDKNFYNYFLAHKHVLDKNLFVDFKLPKEYTSAIENVDLNLLKGKNIQDLYAEKLLYLRKNFDRLRLHYSGGTDSHTILKIAEKNNIQFDHIIMETNSLFDDPYVNQEHAPGIEYAKKYKQFEIFRPTLENYKIFENKNWYETLTGCQGLCPRPVWADLYLKHMTPMVSVSGFDKPWIYVTEDKKYYWLLTDLCFREHMGYDHCVFYIDHIVPEVAVKQAVNTVNFMKKYFPDQTGSLKPENFLKTKKIKKLYNNSIGRVPALNDDILLHKLGKRSPTFLNEKSKRALNELKSIDRHDVVENFFSSVQHLIDEYKNIPYCIRLIDGKFPEPQLRFAAVFEINDSYIKQVSDQDINLQW